MHLEASAHQFLHSISFHSLFSANIWGGLVSDFLDIRVSTSPPLCSPPVHKLPPGPIIHLPGSPRFQHWCHQPSSPICRHLWGRPMDLEPEVNSGIIYLRIYLDIALLFIQCRSLAEGLSRPYLLMLLTVLAAVCNPKDAPEETEVKAVESGPLLLVCTGEETGTVTTKLRVYRQVCVVPNHCGHDRVMLCLCYEIWTHSPSVWMACVSRLIFRLHLH